MILDRVPVALADVLQYLINDVTGFFEVVHDALWVDSEVQGHLFGDRGEAFNCSACILHKLDGQGKCVAALALQAHAADDHKLVEERLKHVHANIILASQFVTERCGESGSLLQIS